MLLKYSIFAVPLERATDQIYQAVQEYGIPLETKSIPFMHEELDAMIQSLVADKGMNLYAYHFYYVSHYPYTPKKSGHGVNLGSNFWIHGRFVYEELEIGYGVNDLGYTFKFDQIFTFDSKYSDAGKYALALTMKENQSYDEALGYAMELYRLTEREASKLLSVKEAVGKVLDYIIKETVSTDSPTRHYEISNSIRYYIMIPRMLNLNLLKVRNSVECDEQTLLNFKNDSENPAIFDLIRNFQNVFSSYGPANILRDVFDERVKEKRNK